MVEGVWFGALRIPSLLFATGRSGGVEEWVNWCTRDLHFDKDEDGDCIHIDFRLVLVLKEKQHITDSFLFRLHPLYHNWVVRAAILVGKPRPSSPRPFPTASQGWYWDVLVVFSWMDMPETPPEGDIWKASWPDARTTSDDSSQEIGRSHSSNLILLNMLQCNHWLKNVVWTLQYFSNIRPIAKHPFLFKIIEKSVFNQLQALIVTVAITKNILEVFQSGFKALTVLNPHSSMTY